MIPTRKQCLKILQELNLPAGIVAHSELVMTVSVFLAERAIKKGQPVNLEKVKAAALLHDLDKTSLGNCPEKHGQLGADILTKRGMGELAPLVKKHPLLCVLDETTAPKSLEEKIVFYADKICNGRIVSLEERGLDWIKRNPKAQVMILTALPLAAAIEKEVLTASGTAFEEIRTN